MNCPCGNPLNVEPVDDKGAALVCASGHRIYVFKKMDGGWETQGERRERLQRTGECISCGSDFELVHRASSKCERRFCNDCLYRHQLAAKKRVLARATRTPNRNGSRWNKQFPSMGRSAR